MRRHPVCRYYAKALLHTAQGIEEAFLYKEQLEAFKSIKDENESLFSALTSTWVSYSKKLQILNDVSSQIGVPEKISRFLKILIKNKRISLFDSIVETYGELLDEKLNIKNIVVVTARNMTDEEKLYAKQQLSLLTQQEIKIENVVDMSIMGGLKLMVDGKVYDNSISSKLDLVRQYFLEN
jgi:F-type H+-transporting ATPase subunit delta